LSSLRERRSRWRGATRKRKHGWWPFKKGGREEGRKGGREGGAGEWVGGKYELYRVEIKGGREGGREGGKEGDIVEGLQKVFWKEEDRVYDVPRPQYTVKEGNEEGQGGREGGKEGGQEGGREGGRAGVPVRGGR
jgi:hypothetical protein